MHIFLVKSLVQSILEDFLCKENFDTTHGNSENRIDSSKKQHHFKFLLGVMVVTTYCFMQCVPLVLYTIFAHNPIFVLAQFGDRHMAELEIELSWG